jgi:hypothetical protein
MSCYAPCISLTLKDHIWTQLSLGYTTKEIYDKHKIIWWNVWMWAKTWHEMISFNFKTLHIWIENIRKGVKFTQQPYNFNSVLGSPTFKKCVLFPICWWNQWDSNPIHHRYSNTNSMRVHAIIWPEWCHWHAPKFLVRPKVGLNYSHSGIVRNSGHAPSFQH